MKNDKPTFNTSSNNNRFRERLTGDKRSQSTSHFEDNKPRRPRPKVNKSPRPFNQNITEKRERKYSDATLESARGTSKVKLTVKGSQNANKPYEKKTGPLSPRAPEKIKKNRVEEMKVYGEKACVTLFNKRPESIVRLWSTVDRAHRIGDILSYLANNKKAYHVVSAQELALVCGTEHHGGVAMLAKKRRPFTLSGYLNLPRKQDAVILLDNVKNPQNLGGILKTCAIYGVKNIITEDPDLFSASQTMRVAEGAAEYVQALQTNNILDALTSLRKEGYQIVHINKKGKRPSTKLKEFSKIVFVISENDTEDLIAKEDVLVNLIPSNPLHQDLNVAVATGALLSHWAMY